MSVTDCWQQLVPWRAAKLVQRESRTISQVRAQAAELQTATGRELRGQAEGLRDAAATACPWADGTILLKASALVCEAVRRALGVTLYDTQLQAGLALARGAIAQVQTGEGKTVAAVIPAFVFALAGQGVHVMTANSYLASRDCQWLRPAFECLGLSVGLLRDEGGTNAATVAEKRAAYACDITYGTGSQFGFDYLRDQLALQAGSQRPLGEGLRALLRGTPREAVMQRGLAAAVIDEADHVLIDDAAAPLVLSDQAAGAAPDAAAHGAARILIAQLAAETDYRIDTIRGDLQLTDTGRRRIYADAAAIPSAVLLRPWSQYVEQALRAERLLRRDEQYVVCDGAVRIVDDATGRISADRSWRGGLHQAIQAKERLAVTADVPSAAYITRQRFFRLYDHPSGMTGTAAGSEHEFRHFYGLKVVEVPLRLPSRRRVLPTRYFADLESKWRAIADEVADVHGEGRPVLVGTPTIAECEALAERLRARGLPHQALDGRQNAAEAAIVSQAGGRGAITLATNVAGRGTDIRLAPGVAELGGLHVIASARHAAQRIDRQLFGRCGRQGDPGSARAFVSADDALIQRHGPWLARRMKRLGGRTGELSWNLDAMVRRLQKRAERADFGRRKQLHRYDRYRDGLMAQLAGTSHDC
jgi:preprotein translocase subunit SecA